ncbi:MAG: hypothetical protein SPD44_11990 [Prevotella sp.]|uniref:tubulin-like doman-containing protein n=1 Tax=Hallella sp. TaxID=2980186 RepID=UPI002A87FAEF|nr:tubulin-like doman-containing protein [Hallella sp.]MDY4753412.1 hypothetical protein [Prevotella sp.]MDY5925540.1 hypothetical protein [Hallella sp.]
MKDQLFVIAIGGTGMRCLEAFVHLCAIGMFDNEEINILTLDTDQGNGNKARVENLIDLYNKVKTNDYQQMDGGKPKTNTFFSAKLNLYRFFTNYSNENANNYQKLSNVPTATLEQREEDKELSDLFFQDDTVQKFNLTHGYRAQTHLGSMLMYHAILQAVRNAVTNVDKAHEEEKALLNFLTLLVQAGQQARVFIFGSVFGGTGASSIPVIPRALADASKMMGGNQLSIENGAKFGSTLLTEYFTFNSPDQNKLKDEGVIASADNFAINSQAALQFYQDDPTVKKCYKRLYLIGWPLKDENFSENNGQAPTGGSTQKNPCHVVELMCACAAYDFFTLSSETIDNIKSAEYRYRCIETVNNTLKFKASDFVDRGEFFLNKLGAFFSLAHLILAKQGAAWIGKNNDPSYGTKGFIGRLKEQDAGDYTTITDQQASDINDYARMFAYSVSSEGDVIVPGWLSQINNSVGSNEFLFASSAFPNSVREIRGIDAGDIFLDKSHKWDKSLKGWGNRYDHLIDILRSSDSKPKEEQGKTVKECFLANLFNAITIAQKFKI